MILPLLVVVQAGAAPAPAPDEAIVVTGRGLDIPPAERVLGSVTLDRDEIAAQPARRLEDVLRSAAGIQQFRRADARSANPTSQGITLRGIGGNASSRALLILDGVPQADPFGGWIAFPAYAVERLGRVRITRGGGSGYAGPGALAGTIELDSALPGDLRTVSGSAAYGSRDGVEADGTVALVRPGGFATLSGAYARGAGFIPIVAEDRGPADRAAGYRTVSGAARAVVTIASTVELQANVSAFDDRRERGLAFTETASTGADASVRLVGRGRWGWSALGYLQTRGFASRFASVDLARAATTPTLDQYNVPATGAGARFELAPPVGGAATLRIGADLRRVSGETNELYTFVAGIPTRRRVAGGASSTLGAFADASLTAGALTLGLGARIDRWTISGGRLVERALAGGAALTDERFADRTGTEATGRAGLAWRVAEPLTLRAAAYRGWRLPTLNELYRPFRLGPDATAADAGLAPERLRGIEAGVTLSPARGVTVSATAFDSRLDGAIANVTVASGPGTFPGVGFVSAAGVYRRRANLDAVASRGIELDATAVRGRVTARLSYAHADARIDAPGTALAGLRPAQTPAHLASASLGWTAASGAGATLVARHAAGQFDDDQNLRRLGAATTLDARLALPLGPVLLEARAENLTDARIEAAIGGGGAVERAAPRTLWIGARLRLD